MNSELSFLHCCQAQCRGMAGASAQLVGQAAGARGYRLPAPAPLGGSLPCCCLTPSPCCVRCCCSSPEHCFLQRIPENHAAEQDCTPRGGAHGRYGALQRKHRARLRRERSRLLPASPRAREHPAQSWRAAAAPLRRRGRWRRRRAGLRRRAALTRDLFDAARALGWGAVEPWGRAHARCVSGPGCSLCALWRCRKRRRGAERSAAVSARPPWVASAAAGTMEPWA